MEGKILLLLMIVGRCKSKAVELCNDTILNKGIINMLWSILVGTSTGTRQREA